jgi:uncharacterized damage-inducible protein DinB
MEAEGRAARTIGQELGWARALMDYTDGVIESIPEEALELRLAAPDGGYFFSARELMMHIADSRWNVAAWVDGEDVSDRQFCEERGGPDKPWRFREAPKAEVVRQLAAGRRSIEARLDRPAAEMHAVSEHQRKSYRQRLELLREQGQDTTALENKGPGPLADVLLFLAAHEQSHRSELQWLMRVNGIKVHRLV